MFYTYTDDALFILTIEEEGMVREAPVYFFDRSVDLAKEMAEHPDDYEFGNVLPEMSNEKMTKARMLWKEQHPGLFALFIYSASLSKRYSR